jgi:hypothetical protein
MAPADIPETAPPASPAGPEVIAIGTRSPVLVTTISGSGFVMLKTVAGPLPAVLIPVGSFSEDFLIFELQAAFRAEIPDVPAT